MKTLFGFTAVIILAGVFAILAAPKPSSRATFLTGIDISKAVRHLSATSATDQPLRTIDGGTSNVGIFIVHRPQEPDQGCTIEHDTLVNDKTTSIFFVLGGAGTIVTGGKLANSAPLPPDDPDLKLVGSGNRGSGIQGGESRRISKGDIVIIPSGVPHGFSAIEKFITYQAVRIDSGKTLPLK
jgi:hypothetical protein